MFYDRLWISVMVVIDGLLTINSLNISDVCDRFIMDVLRN